MTYKPREGVDYLVDLYAVVGVEQNSKVDDLRTALKERAKEYHPDRLEGLAPEFQEKGERMAVLLNRAREILLNDNKREVYDGILADWNGPVSKDGTPIVSTARFFETTGKSSDEIEDIFIDYVARIADMTGYSPSRLLFLEALIEKSGREIPQELREQYEEALLQKDRTLAIEEAERSRLLGLPDIEEQRYTAALGYADEIVERIDNARETKAEQLRMLALGGVSTQLALLSGEDHEGTIAEAIDLVSVELPAYFEKQAAKVEAIARERDNLSDKRLENLLPKYPEDDMQTEFREDLIIGIKIKSGVRWRGYRLDREEDAADPLDLPEQIEQMLDKEDFKTVISKGYGVLTVPIMEHIDPGDLIAVAIGKYSDKYPK